MKSITTFNLLLLLAVVTFSMFLTNCANDTEVPNINTQASQTVSVADYPYPVGVLFVNKDYTYFIEHVTDPGPTDAFMVAGYNDTSTIVILEDGSALVTFTEHPEDWNGGGTLAQRPVQLDPYNVNYDLSGVKTISFEIKSTDFDVNQVSFGVQWEGPDYDINDASKRSGGEKLLTLGQLGIDDITDWTSVIIDVSPGGDIPETGTLRYDHKEVAFHAEQGNTYVKVPLIMIWEGRTHEAGESFEIRNIAFLNETGEHVEIAADILAKAAEHAERE
ncbi:MAG: hypothetical protein LAT67_14980 [Balneolales bacterium]|nr:hypothetical protein [Balneolales bacterium]